MQEHNLPEACLNIHDFLSIPGDSALVDASVYEEHLNYHIQTGDYFGVQAAALGFIEEKLREYQQGDTDSKEYSPELNLVRVLRAEAEHLYKNYSIKSKF